MATESASGFETESLETIHWAAIVLAAITGIIHLVLGVRFISTQLGVPFVLAGLGFFGAIVLFLRDFRRRLLYPVGVLFTGVQVVLYVAFNWPDIFSPAGVIDKVIQLVLIVLLVVLYRREA